MKNGVIRKRIKKHRGRREADESSLCTLWLILDNTYGC